MCKTMSRAKRRHHRARMQKKVENLLKNIWCDNNNTWIEWSATRMRDNMQVCSCYACGNPRRQAWCGKEKITMAEKRAIDNYNDNMEEVDGG